MLDRRRQLGRRDQVSERGTNLDQRAQDVLRVGVRWLLPDVQVLGRSHVTVCRHRVAPTRRNRASCRVRHALRSRKSVFIVPPSGQPARFDAELPCQGQALRHACRMARVMRSFQRSAVVTGAHDDRTSVTAVGLGGWNGEWLVNKADVTASTGWRKPALPLRV